MTHPNSSAVLPRGGLGGDVWRNSWREVWPVVLWAWIVGGVFVPPGDVAAAAAVTPSAAPGIRDSAAQRAALRRDIEVVVGTTKWASPPPGTSVVAAVRMWLVSTVLYVVTCWLLA